MANRSIQMCALMSIGLWGSVPMAMALEDPKGPVILTISGNISETNGESVARFDRDMLMALGVETLETGTPWTEGVDIYAGPQLSTVLEAVGAQGQNLSVTALNDYSANLPVQDAYDHHVMLAMDLNGQAMSIRDKGPIFVLYPFAHDPSLNNEVIHNRSVWQVKSITVN